MRRHYRMSWTPALFMAIARNGMALLSRLRRRWQTLARFGKRLPRGGLMIAIIGADGSGKSTLCRDLTDWLDFKLDAHSLYLGSGDGAGGWVHWLRRRVKKLMRSRQNGKHPSVRTDNEKKSSSTWHKFYRLLDLHLMKRKVRMLYRARDLVRGGSIVICDRYPQDHVIGLSDGPRLQDGRGFLWAAAAERRLYEKVARLGPDVLIRLRVDPQTAQSRKPDHVFEAIVQKCQIADKLQFPQSIDLHIDANRDYPLVLLEAKRMLWTQLNRQER
jgi:thymidylate kinase